MAFSIARGQSVCPLPSAAGTTLAPTYVARPASATSGTSLSTVSVFQTRAETFTPRDAMMVSVVNRPTATRRTIHGCVPSGGTCTVNPLMTVPMLKSAATYASHPTMNPAASPNARRA